MNANMKKFYSKNNNQFLLNVKRVDNPPLHEAFSPVKLNFESEKSLIENNMKLRELLDINKGNFKKTVITPSPSIHNLFLSKTKG